MGIIDWHTTKKINQALYCSPFLTYVSGRSKIVRRVHVHINLFGLLFKFKIFFQQASLIGLSQQNSQTLKTPQHRISIQSKVLK
jgi:hypothetical protein